MREDAASEPRPSSRAAIIVLSPDAANFLAISNPIPYNIVSLFQIVYFNQVIEKLSRPLLDPVTTATLAIPIPYDYLTIYY